MPYRLKKSNKLGLPPGVTRYSGDIKDLEIKIEVTNFQYKDNNEKLHQEFITKDKLKENLNLILDHSITWIDIQGIHDEEIIKTFANHFNFHPVMVEDLLSPLQRPKLDIYGDHLVIFLRRVFDNRSTLDLETDQISIVLGKNYVLSFNELNDNKFEKVKNMIKTHMSLFTQHKNDFLGYVLLDYIVDTYFVEAERVEEEIDKIEDLIHLHEFDGITSRINALKKRNLGLKKIIQPLRDFPNRLSKLDENLVNESTKPFLGDLEDHIYILIDMVDSNRDLISNLKENYASEMSIKMNEVMMTLTVVSSILLPLTFITGLYGMNFQYMPELGWRYSYFIALSVMFFIATSLSLVFRRRKWI